MNRKFPGRSWRAAALCGLLGLALSVWAETDAQKAPAAKKSSTHQGSTDSASTHSTAGTKNTAGSGSHSPVKHTSAKSGKKTKGKTKSRKKRGQQVIDAERARQIQEALIREHYLEGEPSGKWDAATQAAMQRFQADQGWQSKTTPDARALIKLGLGPSPEHLLNPESAMTSAPTATAAKADPPAKTDPKANPGDPPAAPSTKTPADSTPQP